MNLLMMVIAIDSSENLYLIGVEQQKYKFSGMQQIQTSDIINF